MAQPISAEDAQVLHDIGYDAAAFVGSGAFGEVFNGICNQFASKTYEINENEAQTAPPEKVWRTQNRILLEKSLHGKACAIKRIGAGCAPNMAQRAAQAAAANANVVKEAGVLMNLNHPNIVEVYFVIGMPSKNSYVVMEFVNGGTLRSFITRMRLQLQKLTEWQLKTLLTELAQGLRYLHSQGIVHEDLHAGNVMLHNDNSTVPPTSRIKIVDFGLAKVSKTVDPVDGVDVNYMNDIEYLCRIFERLVERTDLDLSNPSAHLDLDTIMARMGSFQYATMDLVCLELGPVLNQMASGPPARARP